MVPRVTVEMNSIEGILATVKTSNLATVLPRLSLGLEMPDFEVFRSTIRHPTGLGLLWKGRLSEQGRLRALADQVRLVVNERWRRKADG